METCNEGSSSSEKATWENLTNDEVLSCFEKSGVLLCLDVPPGTKFGCDIRSWTVGEKFKGIKFLPPGLRFFHYSSGHGMSSAFFLLFGGSAHENQEGPFVSIKRWDATTEDFATSSGMSTEEEERYKFGVKRMDFDSNLGAYQPEGFGRWLSLTEFINQEVLKRCSLDTNVIISPGDPSIADDLDKSDSTMVPFFQNVARAPRFTELPDLISFSKRKRRNTNTNTSMNLKPQFSALVSTPQQRTKLMLDSSPFLDALIRVDFKNKIGHFLGEFQLAFVLFLYIGSYDALEYWKKVINLVCSSPEYQENNPGFLIKLVKVLMTQLTFAPKALFTDELLHDNFLLPALSRLLYQDIQDQSSDVKRTLETLREFLGKRFGPSLLKIMQDVEERQDSPAVVEDVPTTFGNNNVEEEPDPGIQGYKLCYKMELDIDEDAAAGKPLPKRMAWMLPPSKSCESNGSTSE
mmetsp:Transcript_24368/g.29755  ORF Transcript_24368/g.29755 Transcript_24368/m.29755 type:complete len:463 (-) Transcript_24368:966-2354(-)|eukprot:CAMPEP_0204840638 /NCGR_PEP_ID=MMETSP1346-20131115/38317_1 /ASSEMBLY_ACC=CAM_ASM_000771 /TAXON_ID=215587 /ORGANISM="Aplanochytrium stocchinoi, Strain GSBS06" /LENGTH=462 /DNA_ID=CAMNT_0051978157 /DNA_START=50 /DNA_END=1438 /DNA_ORIENTATION=+